MQCVRVVVNSIIVGRALDSFGVPLCGLDFLKVDNVNFISLLLSSCEFIICTYFYSF